MAARRCSTCSINWPLHAKACGKCGGGLWHINEADPDGDEAAGVSDDEDAGVAKSNSKVVDYRRSEFLRMGLDSARSEIAAAARGGIDQQGYAVDLHEFEDLVASGSSPETAYRILF